MTTNEPANEKLAELTYEVRTSRQARGATTQTALLDAAESLFSEQGVDATTVAQIVERAGSSVGSYYHHFGDKETIQFALFDRFLNDAQAATLATLAPERWEGAGVGDVLYSYMRLAVRSHENRPSFKRAAMAISAAHPDLRASHDIVRKVVDQRLMDLLMERRDQIGHPKPKLACAFVINQMQTMLLAREESLTPPNSNAEFLREMVRLLCGYLETDLPT